MYLVRKKRRINLCNRCITLYGIFSSKEKAINWIDTQRMPEQYIIDEIKTDSEMYMELW